MSFDIEALRRQIDEIALPIEEEVLLVPEARIAVAGLMIEKALPSLHTVKWIAGFGSFWDRNIRRKPSDLDLVVSVTNGAEWLDEKGYLTAPLHIFGLPLQIEHIDLYAPVIGNMGYNYQIILRNAATLSGVPPAWLANSTHGV